MLKDEALTLKNIENMDVKAVFGAWPADMRAAALDVRGLILAVAGETEGVGPLDETLKWGEPAYLTTASKSGSTLRLAPMRGQPDKLGLFVNCRTTLIDDFRTHYGDELTFEGKRAVVLDVKSALPRAALGHCIALALTYHSRKKA